MKPEDIANLRRVLAYDGLDGEGLGRTIAVCPGWTTLAREVVRLTDECVHRDALVTALDAGQLMGADKERVAIVAFIRTFRPGGISARPELIAAIEAGKHLEGK